MQIENPKQNNPLNLILIVFVIMAALAAAYVMFGKSKAVPAYQVASFIGNPEVYSQEEKEWVPVTRGMSLGLKDTIRTNAGTEVDVLVHGKFQIRIKENSIFGSRSPGIFESEVGNDLQLLKGVMLGSTGKEFTQEDILRIKTPVGEALVKGTLFRVAYDPDDESQWAGVIQGHMEVKSEGKTVILQKMEKSEIVKGEAPSAARKLSRAEYLQLREAYDLIEKKEDYEARQRDLAKEAGTLFEKVFDNGTFFMPKYGFAHREFFREEDEGKVWLNIEYDVYPVGSYVGVYLKTRSLDLSQYEGIEFEVRRVPGEDYPEGFKVETKSGGNVSRRFVVKDIGKAWRKETLKFSASKETRATEITLLFEHAVVGSFKKGIVQFRNINLIEKAEA